MAKKLFQNYTFSFDSNEIKVLNSFCKQAVNQMSRDEKFDQDVKIFNSILDKINSGQDEIKFTKIEKTRLNLQLKENRKYLKKKMDESWIIKKWFFKTMYNQYNSLLENHFEN